VLFAGALCFLAVWATSVALLWAAEPYLVFMTDLSRSDTVPFDPKVFHQRSFANDDGLTLSAVVLTHEPRDDRYWIMFCPPAGSSTRVIWTQEQLKDLWRLGYNVFAFDYRGFGANAGQPTEQGIYADAIAAHAYLVDAERIHPSRIILAGRSLGSAVAVDLAIKVPSAGLLLFAPIDSLPSAASRIYPWAPVRLLSQYQFDSAAKAKSINVPVVMFHGWPDTYMHRSDARALLAEFRGPKMLVETGGGHHFAGFEDLGGLNRAVKKYWPAKTSHESSRSHGR
jgi:fermentation-respiration switch protein FrsA (DUF1100 family)